MAWTDITTPTGGTAISTTAFGGPVVDNFAVVKNHSHDGTTGGGSAIAIPIFTAGTRLFMQIRLGALVDNVSDADYNNAFGAWTAVDDSTQNTVYLRSADVALGTEMIFRLAHVSTRVLPRMRMGVAHEDLDVSNVIRLGFADGSLGADATNWIGFRAAGNANWFAVTENGGTETATDTGVAASQTLRDFYIDVTATGSVSFYIDNALEATHTTNIPAATTVMRPRIGIAGAGGNQRMRLAQVASVSFMNKAA